MLLNLEGTNFPGALVKMQILIQRVSRWGLSGYFSKPLPGDADSAAPLDPTVLSLKDRPAPETAGD